MKKVRYFAIFSNYIVLFVGPSDRSWTCGLLNPITLFAICKLLVSLTFT